MLLEINENYTCAYYLKEQYLKFNREATPTNADKWLTTIIESFTEADIPEYREFVKTLINWRQEIVNSFYRPYQNRKLSNALVENINGHLRMFLAVSKGTRNFARFRKRALYALNNKIFYSITKVLKSSKEKGRKRGKYNS